MSVFKIPTATQPDGSTFEINSIFYSKLLVNFQEALLYLIDIEALKNKMPGYRGGKNKPAKLKFRTRNDDYSLVHLAVDPNNDNVVLENVNDWAILVCPIGNVNGPTPSIHETYEDLHKFLYPEDFYEKTKSKMHLEIYVHDVLINYDKIITYLKNKDLSFDQLTVQEIITLALDEANKNSINWDNSLPSRTSINEDFLICKSKLEKELNYELINFKLPTIKQLDRIFNAFQNID